MTHDQPTWIGPRPMSHEARERLQDEVQRLHSVADFETGRAAALLHDAEAAWKRGRAAIAEASTLVGDLTGTAFEIVDDLPEQASSDVVLSAKDTVLIVEALQRCADLLGPDVGIPHRMRVLAQRLGMS